MKKLYKDTLKVKKYIHTYIKNRLRIIKIKAERVEIMNRSNRRVILNVNRNKDDKGREVFKSHDENHEH